MYFTPETILYFNGECIKATDATINLYSQSLHYGYAVFEGIRAYNINNQPQIFKAKEHYERLIKSAQIMQIPFTYTWEKMEAITYDLLKINNLTNAYIRPLVVCSPNMGLTKGKESYLVIQVWDWTNGYLANKLKAATSSFQRPNPKAFYVEAKVSGHYVNSILASQEAKDNGFDEALVLDSEGFVAESSGANVFYEKDGILYTPPKGNILLGITRATVIEICNELNIEVKEQHFTPQEMQGADAGFFCGTAAEVVALDSLDSIPFTKSWEDTKSFIIQKAYKAKVLQQEFSFSKVAS